MTKPLEKILADLKEHLLDLKDQGISDIEADPGLVKRLGIISAAVSTGRSGMTRAVARTGNEVPQAAGKAEKQPDLSSAATAVQTPARTGRTSVSATGTSSELQKIADEIAQCKACRLALKRTNTVPGQGNPAPEVMFVGEGPGEDEDLQGLAFVGRAGQLLTKMIEAMGFTREEVFIGNIVKCRPPDNRKPEPDEMETCIPFLKRQIAILKPKVLVALGATAVQGLVGMPEGIGITKIRGQWKTYEGIDLMQTLHPSYLLRNPSAKKDAWEDLKAVLRKLGRPVPKR